MFVINPGQRWIFIVAVAFENEPKAVVASFQEAVVFLVALIKVIPQYFFNNSLLKVRK